MSTDSNVTFPADESLTPELIALKMNTVANQYNDRECDYYAPMLYNSHWYLALIKTEHKLKSALFKDQPITSPGKIVISFQGMNGDFSKPFPKPFVPASQLLEDPMQYAVQRDSSQSQPSGTTKGTPPPPESICWDSTVWPVCPGCYCPAICQ